MKTTIKKHMLVLFVAGMATLAAGCGSDNPVAPQTPDTGGGGGEEVTILIPKKMKITKTTLSEFPATKSNGDDWDNGITEVNRRPDTFFRLGNYRTAVHVNHRHGVFWTLPWDGGFARMNYEGSYELKLYDDDDGVLQGADDYMSTIVLKPSELYQNNNAKTFSYYFNVSNTKVWIEGEWVY
jgi:hypothetical protein